MTTAPATAPSKPSSGFSKRIFNFSAGPGVMPEEVLRQIQEDVWNCRNSGVGILEHSHRAKVFDKILEEVEADAREVAKIPANYRVMFLTGGASAQNWMIPANFMPQDKSGTADYFNTGYWAQRSIEDAKFYGAINDCASSKADNYQYIPTAAETKYTPGAKYIHYTSNNTIYGTQFHYVPTAPAGVPLCCDMCSDICSRPFDVTKYALIYAGAQKNLGPAGTTVVIARDDFIESGNKNLPNWHQYRVFAKEQSRPNTPPVFPMYCVGLVFKWIKKQGGLEHFAKYNQDKATVLYNAIDNSKGFFKGHARPDSRSLMNITFRCPTAELDDKFCAEATKQGFDCLKGHRATGGMRASLYNAMPREGSVELAKFMAEFQRVNG